MGDGRVEPLRDFGLSRDTFGEQSVELLDGHLECTR
jgi:hypothetical protein